MVFFLCENLSRAWDLIFSKNAHTGYTNVHAKNYYPCSLYLAKIVIFSIFLAFLIANKDLNNDVRHKIFGQNIFEAYIYIIYKNC